MLFTPKFAIGHLYVYPNGGLQPTNASGTELQVIQDFSVDFAGKAVELRGQFLYPIDARVADISLKGKFKVGEWSLEQLNNIFFAGTVTTGSITDQVYADELYTVPASAPYTVTVTNAAGFVQPLSVALASNYSNLDEVATSPAAGQYTASAGGAFGFNVAQAGQQVLISYLAGGTGAQLSVPNNLQGQSPVVGIAGYNAADGNGFLFPNCRVSGIKPIDLKNNAYAMNEVDFQVYCPTGQAVCQILQTNY
jgi:hypothetical protein